MAQRLALALFCLLLLLYPLLVWLVIQDMEDYHKDLTPCILEGRDCQ